MILPCTSPPDAIRANMKTVEGEHDVTAKLNRWSGQLWAPRTVVAVETECWPMWLGPAGHQERTPSLACLVWAGLAKEKELGTLYRGTCTMVVPW